MKTVRDIMKAIISGTCPHTEIGILMELLAYNMAYDWRF